MVALRQRAGTSFEFYGIGGSSMQKAGLESLFDIEELAVIGPAAVIGAIPRGYRLAKKLVRTLMSKNIDALIIIDSPEFNHPVARWLREAKSGLPIFNLVAPTVWAWRSWRARKMKPYIHEVLAVLPFEPRVFAELGGPACTFVGHPAVDRAKRNTMTAQAFRKKYNISDDQVMLLMLPGSRRGEIARHMAIFAEAAKRFTDVVDGVKIVMPVIPHMKAEVSLQLQNLQIDVLQIEDEGDKWGAFRAANLALAASGTVTLELTATHTPMIVGYRVDAIASFIAKFPYLFKWLIDFPSMVLPNLIMGENVVPEFFDRDCHPEALSSALIEIHQSDVIKENQREFLVQAAIKVGCDDPHETAERAAEAILKRLNVQQSPTTTP
jgi:lipid-A-disaccharide synthase